MIVTIAVIFVLLMLNAFFVAAEFAIVSAPRSAIDARAARRDPLARLVQKVLKDPRRQDRYIATAQIGITVASLGLGMYGEHKLAEWVLHAVGESTWAVWLVAHGFSSIVAIGILTYFHIVLGEMLPKSMALQAAERIALWLTPPMLWIQWVIFPLVVILNGLGNLLLKPFGISPDSHHADKYYTPEELQFIV
jgi:CBS domain containing-hemolysin-like protein